MLFHRIPKVPLIIQMENTECGAASLAMILGYWGKWVSLSEIREKCSVSRDGANALNILKAARSYGLEAKGVQYSAKGLRDSGIFPCICFWNGIHFLVVKGFRNNHVYINDPNGGMLIMPMEEFETSFSGICLQMKPGPDFKPSGKQNNVWAYVWEQLKDKNMIFILMSMTTLVASLFSILTPFFSRVYIDNILGHFRNDALWTLLALTGIFVFLQMMVMWVKTDIWQKIQAGLAADSSADFMWKMLHLPLRFYSQRTTGDILSRRKETAYITDKLINTLTPLVFNLLMMLIYLVVMLIYSPLLSIVGLVGVGLNLLSTMIFSRRRQNALRLSRHDNAMLMSTTLSGIAVIETIKSKGAEETFFQRWAGYQAAKSNKDFACQQLDLSMGKLSEFILSVTNTLILLIGVSLVFGGETTVGVIMSFQGIFGMFASPVQDVFNTGKNMLEMQTLIERQEDIMKYPEDNSEEVPLTEENAVILRGEIDMRNVSFSYDANKPLIQNFNMHVEPGHSVALVGFSGCGKSTIIRLLTGLFQPQTGEILFDGKQRSKYPQSVLTGSVAVVNQTNVVFDGSVENNMRVWDETITENMLMDAAREVGIHDAIVARSGGYHLLLQSSNPSFSGGQLQSMELARALAQDPSVLILDEATSALDATLENQIMKTIKARHITTVIAAHRLSTIRDCDEIIVMDKGCVVERGTHEELCAADGLYSKLISSM